MKNYSKKTILSILLLSLIPFCAQAIDWNSWLSKDDWVDWAVTGLNKLRTPKPAESEDQDNGEEFIDLDTKNVAQEDNTTKENDFYASLGIKFFPEKYLVGSDATLKKQLNTLFQNKKNKGAVAYFISIERKNHNLAISILEELPANNRLTILLESPSAFIAKLLVDMRKKDFVGKTLYHWGKFKLESQYFGSKEVDNAEIKGESITLQYITFLLLHNTKTQEDFKLRAYTIADIFSKVASEDLPSLLVYTNEEAAVKLGKKHKSCFGAVKSKGYCDEETIIQLPADFVAKLLNGMHKNNMITNQDLVNILETEFKINQDRFQTILSMIDKAILQEIILNFSEEVHAFLPDDVILQAIPHLEEDKTLKISDKTNNGTTIPSIEEDSNNSESDKEDL